VTTSTSLNLRALLKDALVRSGMDGPSRAVAGLTPSAMAFYVAGAAHALPRGVVLYVVPGAGEVDETVENCRFFLGALDGLSPAAIERAVLPFPSHEIDPYRGLAPHVVDRGDGESHLPQPAGHVGAHAAESGQDQVHR